MGFQKRYGAFLPPPSHPAINAGEAVLGGHARSCRFLVARQVCQGCQARFGRAEPLGPVRAFDPPHLDDLTGVRRSTRMGTANTLRRSWILSYTNPQIRLP